MFDGLNLNFGVALRYQTFLRKDVFSWVPSVGCQTFLFSPFPLVLLRCSEGSFPVAFMRFLIFETCTWGTLLFISFQRGCASMASEIYLKKSFSKASGIFSKLPSIPSVGIILESGHLPQTGPVVFVL